MVSHLHHRHLCVLLLLLWGALLSLARAAEPPARVLEDRHYDTQALVPASALLKDAEGRLSFDDVRRLDAQGAFQPLQRPFGAGYVRDVYWLRIAISRAAHAPSAWWLQLAPPYLDDVRLYHVGPDGALREPQRAGDHRPPRETVEHRYATFELDLAAPGTHVLYLRVASISALSLLPRLIPQADAPRAWLQEYLLLGGYSGAAVAMVVAALFAVLLMRQRIYLLFALFVTCSTLQWFGINGLARQFLFRDDPVMADRMTSSLIAVTTAAGLLFFAHLFDYRRRYRWLYRANMASALAVLVAAVVPFVGPIPGVPAFVGAVILGNIALMLLPVRRLWREGAADMRVGLVAFTLYVTLVAVNVASVLGLVPPSDTLLQGAHIGNLVQLFVLLLAIFTRAMRAEKARQQAESEAARAVAEHERERLAREEQAHLVSMMAHEIRTPVAVIDAALQSLRVLDEQVTPERALRHQRIERALGRMNTLVELALAQDRLEVANWTQDLDNVDLHRLTQDTVELAGGAAGGRLTIDAASGGCEVRGDERMLRFALLNLVDNALKYSPRDTPVEVSIGALAQEGRPGCRWAIVDRGPGVAEADRERVFQKYYRAPEVAQSPGLGLGLYLVRQIVQRHRGWVRVVAPAHGGGTCFECWLPLRQPQEADA